MHNKYLKNEKLSIALFLALFIVNATVYMTKNMFSAAMATIVEEGVMTKAQTGAISASFWFVYAICQIFGGFAADKFSPFRLIGIGLVSGIISNLIISVNQSYTVIMVVWCLNAAFQFGLWPGVFKIVSSQTAPAIRGTAVFWVILSNSAGQALSLFVASLVKRWQQNFVVSAVSLIVMFVFWTVFYKNIEKSMVENTVTGGEEGKKPENKADMKSLVRLSGFPVLALIAFLIVTINNGIKMVTPVMLTETYHNMPAAIATRLSVLLVVFSTLGMFVANFVRTKVTQHEMKAIMLLLALSLPALFVTCFVGKISYLIILAVLAVGALFIHGAYPFSNSFAAARFSDCGRNGTVSGILNGAAAVGNIFASYVIPKMSESMSWSSIVLFWIGFILAATLLAAGMMRKWTSFIGQKEI